LTTKDLTLRLGAVSSAAAFRAQRLDVTGELWKS